MVMNFELCTHGIHHVIIEVLSIIYYDELGKAISINDVIFDKVGYLLFRQICDRSSIYLFSETIKCHKNERVPIGSLSMNHTNCINAPH